MDSLYVVMPAYNEEANIRRTIEQWYPILEGKAENSRLVIADSGSSDNTHSILQELQSQYPQLLILDDTMKQHGPKVYALYKYAFDNEIDYVFQTDSDGQTDPNEFNDFWENRTEFDGIFGNRTVRGDGKDRAFVERVVCLLVRIFYGVKVPDANAPFRLMKVSVVSKYMNLLDPDYNLPNIMMTTFFAYFNEKLTFKEITFKPRQGGKNSINIPRIIKIGWKALGDFRRIKKRMKQV